MKLTLAAVAALMVVPGIAMAQQDTTRMQRDTGMRSDTGQQGVQTDTSRGEVAGRNMGLSTQQVIQLQTALDSAGFTVTADGSFGPQTKQAISCFQQKENISGQNLNEVLRRLNLNFTASDSLLPPAGVQGDTSGMRMDTSGMRMDTSGMRMDTSGMRTDTSGMQMDTSMKMDTSGMRSDTSFMRSDTSRSDTSTVRSDTSTMQRDTSRTKPRG